MQKVVVVMGATGTGKSRLALDLASHFSVEILNADSMQVYEGLDILTNKVSVEDRRGVPHHLMGTIGSDTEFTAKDFRDLAIPLIDQIWSRSHLPIIVGGTNYYIQALVSPLLLDEWTKDMEQCSINASLGIPGPYFDISERYCDFAAAYDCLKKLDPSAADRIHPNDHRKVKHYLELYERYGLLPSCLFQGEASLGWGQANLLRYMCCFIWLDVSLPVLDRIVEQRVDIMVESGLLEEISDFYKMKTDYSRGLQQAVGVHEFEAFLGLYQSRAAPFNSQESDDKSDLDIHTSLKKCWQNVQLTPKTILDSDDKELVGLLTDAIDKMKMNTRRLVRRQAPYWSSS